MIRTVVCGAGGFIGSHLVRLLKMKGYWVRGIDLKYPEFWETEADEFILFDLRANPERLLDLFADVEEVYQLAADMGGMGFIHTAETSIMHHNALINAHVLDAAAGTGVQRYFFSSSVCVYPDMAIDADRINEDHAYPAYPDNEYGWEKLYAERMALAYARATGMQVRIARFENCYGSYGTWEGERAKAPAALCRKVAETTDGSIDVWGDGTAVRNFIHVSDLIRAVDILMHSDEQRPVNIGTEERVSINQLVTTISDVAGKRVHIRHVNGPVGVQSRNFNHERMWALGWTPRISLYSGISLLYPWIEKQVGVRV